jgi:hypothetical protein
MLRDESGTTLTEVLVAMVAGATVLLALSTMIIGSIHQSSRVSARVDATQRARLTLSKLMEELHSACVAPQVAPIYPESNGLQLIFIHQSGGAAVLTPVKSKVTLKEGVLKQEEFAVSGGAQPKWTFAEKAFQTRTLMTGVSPISPSASIFSYYGYTSGQGTPTAITPPLNEETAPRTVQVNVAFTTAASTTPVADKGAPASFQDSALLRLTSISYNKEVVAPPCQ